MDVSAKNIELTTKPSAPPPSIRADSKNEAGNDAQEKKTETQEVFQDFVGQTFFGQLIKSMRSSQQPSAYFHGGRAEEVFQAQFDQVLSEKLSDASAEKMADPMFELFMLNRSK